MSIRKLAVEFVAVSSITLATSVIVTLLWNIIRNGAYAVDWETSFLFAVLLGILLALRNWWYFNSERNPR